MESLDPGKTGFLIMFTLIVLYILNALTCMASSMDSQQEPTKIFTLSNVGELVCVFTSHRHPPGSLEFCAEMDELNAATLSIDYFQAYLTDGGSNLFDRTRKMFRICNGKGFEYQKKLLVNAMESAFAGLYVLALCLPYTPDFDDAEHGLVRMLKEMDRKYGYISEDGRMSNGKQLIYHYFLGDK